jgi:hypothetical protein
MQAVSDLQRVIAARREQLIHRRLASTNNAYWTIIGSGSIGAKAEELKNKSWAIEQAGFTLIPRTVFAMGFFEDFRERSGINDALKRGASSEELLELVRNTEFNKSELERIGAVAAGFKNVPVAVRSSAHGDCRGTGIYKSEFVMPRETTHLANAIRLVLESEFSESAIAFRKDVGLPNGMAVIVEPVFGQCVEASLPWEHALHKFWGPNYGGLAYSTTSSGEGVALFTGGLPINSVRGKGVRVFEGDNRRPGDVLFDFEIDFLAGGLSPRDAYGRMGIPDDEKEGKWIDAEHGTDMEVSIHPKFTPKNFKWLFKKLKKLELLLGKPQYVEWAVVENGMKPKTALLQIADMALKHDFYEMASNERTIMRSDFVAGSGVKICKEIVHVLNPDDVHLLSEYNRTHEGYVVMYAGRLISRLCEGGVLDYCHLSNSGVVVENPEMHHSQNPLAHFGGELRDSGKFLIVANEINWDFLRTIEKEQRQGKGVLSIYPIEVKVTCSERQQKAVVELVGGDVTGARAPGETKES